MKLTVNLIDGIDEIIASCPELDINCYAATENDAIKRMLKVLQFYIESARELGLEVDTLDKIEINGEYYIPEMEHDFLETPMYIN